MPSSTARLRIILITAASLVAGACGADTSGTDGGPAEPETEGITLYSGRIPAAIGGAVDIYEAEADRDVQVRFADTADLAATLVEEGDNSPADTFFAQEPGAIGAVAAEDLLAKLPQDILDRVPPAYRDPNGYFVGVTGRARILAYNESVPRSELPDSPLELTAPEWEGRVGWGPVTASLQQYEIGRVHI
jgi:iron(III) transport system substrate-binding protein